MKSIQRFLDNLLIYAISLTGVQVYGLTDYIEVDCLPEYPGRGHLDPESPRRRPALRLRFAHP